MNTDIRTIAEMLNDPSSDLCKQIREREENWTKGWGRWKLNRKLLTLEIIPYENDGTPYEIDLETIKSSIHVLDWVLHMKDKSLWVTPDDIYNLIDALDVLSGGLRGNYNKRLNIKDVVENHFREGE